MDAITIDEREYTLDTYYNRLESVDSEGPEVACPNCHGTKFAIAYGNCECIAVCSCGHRMVIYDG